MSKVRETIDVDVPLRSAYNQWTQFEDFPRFMDGVEEVRQTDDRRCHWTAKVAGAHREFDTEIVDQQPDERISWRTVGGDVRQKGVVTFQRLDDAHTRVSLVMDFEPHGMAERAGDLLGVLDRQVKGDLKRFKGFIEEQDRASGAWRGRLAPDGGPASPAAGEPVGLGDTRLDGPQARMTGEGAPPLPVDPDDMRHG
ncbi:SRPBCC family protein [Kitasatospora nipponensis]|uniref:SRPBCC family protein n=1 Tax=Kitasatospora nipponensis TaxID=258049 RepID=A0ABN1WAU5_9ACTN